MFKKFTDNSGLKQTIHKCSSLSTPCVDPEGGGGGGGGGGAGGGGGQGVQNPLENHKFIGFLGNTGLDPLESYKATKPAFKVRPSLACQVKAI